MQAFYRHGLWEYIPSSILAHELINIKSLNNNATEVTVLVRNTLGKVLIKQLINLRDGDGEVMTNHLPTGVYIVQLIDKTSNKYRIICIITVVKTYREKQKRLPANFNNCFHFY
ncbi:T9SS type A sorting domain-containing protein, partial [bacterium]